MSKGIYRSVNVEGVVSAALVALLSTATVIVGIDVAKFDLAAAFALDTGQVVQIVKFKQLQQTHLFLALIAALQQAGRTVQIAMEPTGTYGDALREKLHGAGAAIFMVPAKHVHDARELYDNVPSKHDPKDAVTLARLRSQGNGSLWKPVDPFRRDVRALVEVRNVHHEPLMQGYNRLEGLLARHWPELSSLVHIYETTSVWKLLLKMPGPREIAARPQEARELLSKESRRTLKEAAIEAIVVCARDTMGVAPTRLERTQLQRVVSEMLRHREELRKIDREIRTLLETRPEFGAMVRWVGPVTIAVLIGCVGDPLDFHHAGAYEKACGLNLKEQSSGVATRRGLHITHRGSACARKYLYLFALRWKARDPAARAWVEGRQSWPRQGGKVSALVALMRKAASALWHLRRGQDYQASKLFDLRRLVLAPSARDALITEADASESEAPCPPTCAATAPEAESPPRVVADRIEREATAPAGDDASKARPARDNAPMAPMAATEATTTTATATATTTASDDASKAAITTKPATKAAAKAAATSDDASKEKPARNDASQATTATTAAATTHIPKRGATARRGSREDRGGATSERRPRTGASDGTTQGTASASDESHAGTPDVATPGTSTSARASASRATTAPSHGAPSRTLSSTLERLNALVRTSR